MLKKKILVTILSFSLLAVPFLVTAAAANLGIEYGTATGLGEKDVRETIATIINVLLGILGIVCVVIVIAGGFLWMTAAGNEEKVEKAKKLLGAGVIGLIIILAAYAIAKFVLGQIQDATV